MKETDYLEGNQQIVNDLKKIPVFEPFSESDLEHLLKMSRLRVYESGEDIIREGQVDAWVYFLVYGRVRITQKGQEVAVLRRRGDVFGEMRFVAATPRSASAHADDHTVCIAVDTENIQKLTGSDKLAFGYLLYRIFSEILADRLRMATQELMQRKGKSGIKFWQ